MAAAFLATARVTAFLAAACFLFTEFPTFLAALFIERPCATFFNANLASQLVTHLVDETWKRLAVLSCPPSVQVASYRNRNRPVDCSLILSGCTCWKFAITCW